MIKNVVIVLGTMLVIAGIGCSVWVDPCPGGKECGGGCIGPNDDCCDAAGDYCSYPSVCSGYGTCVGGGVSGCLAMGEETCHNYDGIDDCAPFGADCCGNHTFCPAGRVCCSGGCC